MQSGGGSLYKVVEGTAAGRVHQGGVFHNLITPATGLTNCGESETLAAVQSESFNLGARGPSVQLERE